MLLRHLRGRKVCWLRRAAAGAFVVGGPVGVWVVVVAGLVGWSAERPFVAVASASIPGLGRTWLVRIWLVVVSTALRPISHDSSFCCSFSSSALVF